MWMLFARTPRADARYWPGRRTFALIDAVIWPVVAVVGVLHIPAQTGVVGQVALAVCGLAAVRRAWRAGLVNHRYRFTSASAATAVVALLVIAAALKVAG